MAGRLPEMNTFLYLTKKFHLKPEMNFYVKNLFYFLTRAYTLQIFKIPRSHHYIVTTNPMQREGS